MKTFITLLTILLAMVFVVPAFAGEEPYKASVWDDKSIPYFHISPKVYQFTHEGTNYYNECNDVIDDVSRVTEDCEEFGEAWLCPSACRETFKTKNASMNNMPEICCAEPQVVGLTDTVSVPECPDERPWGKTQMISAGNSGVYEWTIALPKKPEGELNIEMQCGVLKPNSLAIWDPQPWKAPYRAVNICAAVTGEPIAPGLCVRQTGAPLKASGLPQIEVIAHPGCLNDFEPFHLTAYRMPSRMTASSYKSNTEEHQVLDGSKRSRVALKACLEESIMVVWPKEGRENAYDKDPAPGLQSETEATLHAGDLIKVRMTIPGLGQNTVDIFCGKYSVTIGGIGEPYVLSDDTDYSCPCISDKNCTLDEL